MLFLFFSQLISVAKLSRTGKTGKLTGVPDHCRNVLCLKFSLMLTLGFLCCMRYDLSIHSLHMTFIMTEYWILLMASSVSIDINMWFLSLSLFMQCILFIDLICIYRMISSSLDWGQLDYHEWYFGCVI